ncbi:MAG: hypothetical protein QW035_04655 [Candidatus Anstonellales archaeon]
MKKAMVAFDLDDVLADFTSKLIEWHNATYGTSFKKNDFFSFRFWEVWGGNERQAFNKILSFYSSDFFLPDKAHEGSHNKYRKTLQKL